MSKPILSSITLFLIALSSFGQTRGDNFIIIQTKDAPEVAYRKIAAILQDQGYNIDKSDKDLMTLSTELVDNGLPNAGQMMLSVYVRGQETAQVHVSGKSTAPGLVDEPSRIEFRGMKGSPAMMAWVKMQEAAAAYPDGSLTFGKK